MNPLAFPFAPLGGENVAGATDHGSVVLPAAPGVLDLHIPLGANCVLLQASNQAIRYTLQGTDPTTTRGFLLATADPPILVAVTKFSKFKFTAAAAGAVLQYEFGQNPIV